MTHQPRRERRRSASASPASCPGAGSVEVTGGTSRPSVRRNASPESPSPAPTLTAQLETGSRRDAPLRVLEVIGPLPVHAPVDSPKPRRQAAASVQGSATPRTGGRLSAAAGCGEHTVRWSPAVTTTRSTRLSEPWHSDSAARTAADAWYVAIAMARVGVREKKSDHPALRLSGARSIGPAAPARVLEPCTAKAGFMSRPATPCAGCGTPPQRPVVDGHARCVISGWRAAENHVRLAVKAGRPGTRSALGGPCEG